MPYRWLTLAFAVAIAASNAAHAAPSRVIIIRHGEKPPSGNKLDSQGCERACLLPGFFRSMLSGPPSAIFASAPDDSGGSVRPVETISPTAASYDPELPVLDPTTRLQFADAVAAVNGYDGTVFMAWEHDAIPALAQQFGVQNGPREWPSDVFDEAWVLSFAFDGATPTLEIVPENVLPGDNPLGGIPDWQNPPGAFNPTPIPPGIAHECANTGTLDGLAEDLARPPLPNKFLLDDPSSAAQ